MQNETNALKEAEIKDEITEKEAQSTISSDGNFASLSDASNQNKEDSSSNKNPHDDTDAADFEELIKGPYKDAFAKKVQSIINKRFKEQKVAEKSATESKTETNITHPDDGNKVKSDNEASTDSTYNSLLEAGIDPETAYRVLHLDEIMDSSMRYGAELAAKQLTDSLRKKAARPFESALSQKGYSAKATASTLTPEKRKELAKKALMGEQIGF